MATSDSFPNSGEAFSFFSANPSPFISMLKTAVADVDTEEIIDSAEEMIQQPREEKFTQPNGPFKTIFNLEENDVDELEVSDLPPPFNTFFEQINTRELLVALMNAFSGEVRQQKERLQLQILDRPRDVEGYLILSVLLMYIEEFLRYIADSAENEELADWQSERIIGTYNVLFSHLLLIGEKRKEKIYPELVEDLFYAPYYIEQARGEEPKFEFGDHSLQEMYRAVLIRGAVNAYDELDITVSRGAELAGVSRTEFEQYLAANGIRPNYGPTSVNELNSGVVL